MTTVVRRSGATSDRATAAESEEEHRNWHASELIGADHSFNWLVKGLLPEGSQSVTGGEKKSLKSYFDTMVNVGLAAGVPILGRFEVPAARPVKVYVGEGGRQPYARRLERVARAMGVTLDSSIPLYVQFETAPILHKTFREWQETDLERLGLGRMSLDPLYPFHGAVNASNLYERGAMLNAYSEPCTLTGVSPNIVDHFKKTGDGRGLDRLAQAGMAEWADSWILLTHREPPQVEAGRFKLLLEVGSRQWGGREWDLDLELGRFDEDRCDHVGEISWNVTPHVERERGRAGWEATERNIRAVLDEHPFEHTQTQIASLVGGNRDRFRKVWTHMADDGIIEERAVRRREGDREVTRAGWGVSCG